MTWQRVPLQERLERNSSPEPNTGCWLWTGNVDAYGYGSMHNRTAAGGNKFKAHRVAYQIYIGEIPEGKYVCHKCDTPSCINPRHLWLGTHEDNQNDRIAKGRSAKGSDFKHSKLNESLILQIRGAQGTMKQIGALFGIAPQTAWDIRKRRIWAHIQ